MFGECAVNKSRTMTVMYSFCLWFPVRLGTIIVAITCAAESLACLIVSVIGLYDLEGTSKQIDNWLKTNDLITMTDVFMDIRRDPEPYLNGLIGFFSVHICTCPLVILGAFKCNAWLLYPFVGIDFVRLVLLSILLVLFLLIIKANTLTLGLVIGFSIFGGFLLLYFWYQWFCVISLCQIIREVQKMSQHNQIAPSIYPSTISQKISNQDYPHLYSKTNNVQFENKRTFLPQATF